MADEVNQGLDAIIAKAVETKIEAVLASALAGDEIIGQYVIAALQQPIEVGSSYQKVKTTFLKHTIDECLRAATKAAVQKYVLGETAVIEAAVAKALRQQSTKLASQFTEQLVKSASTTYGINVELRFPGRD